MDVLYIILASLFEAQADATLTSKEVGMTAQRTETQSAASYSTLDLDILPLTV